MPKQPATNQPATNAETATTDDTTDLTSALQRLADRAVRGRHVHGVLFGVESDDGSSRVRVAAGDARADAPYAIASITKMFTAAIVLRLVDEGRLRLEEPVGALLPDLELTGLHRHRGVDRTDDLSVHHLLHQTSGLADYWNGGMEQQLARGEDRAYSIQDTIDLARDAGAEFPPGDRDGRRSAYSDTNFQLLTAIIESVTGRSYADEVHDRIVLPLGLTSTYVVAGDADCPAPLTLRHGDRVLSIPRALESERGAGSVVSSLDDQLRFSRAWHGGELFSGGLRRAAPHWNQVIFFALGYGHGVMRYRLPRWMTGRAVPEMMGHSGSTGSFLFRIPDLGCHVAGSFNQFGDTARPFRLLPRLARTIATAQQTSISPG